MYNVILVTGSRAEYGIMKNLIKKLNESEKINLKIVACAMHMEEKYGYTYKEIEKDGFNIDLKVDMNLKDTKDDTILKSMSILQNQLADYYSQNKFDLTIILGDRYEMLSVVNCSVLNKVPICHLHGGEKTLGNYDEFIRHSITKMSHLHLASTDEYKKRIIQLGEEIDKVYNIGSLGVENVLTEMLLSSSEIKAKLNLNDNSDYFVILFHPVTLETKTSVKEQTINLLKALDNYKEKYSFIFIGSNSDSGSDEINTLVDEFVAKNSNCRKFKSLSVIEYHSAVKYSKGLIGNSSSGIIEVPSLEIYTLNIGNRQEGRVRGNSIIDVDDSYSSILKGIEEIINKENINIINPYYKENASQNAFGIIIDELDNNLSIKKVFNDINF